jgi:hypothetical protein
MSNESQAKYAQYGNGEAIQGSLSVDSKTYYVSNPAASTDPFNAKTNKYAEKNVIAITSAIKGCFAKFSSDASAASAASDNFLIPADTTMFFEVKSDKKYLRVIRAEDGALVMVTELY